jgi:hypothetical protein
LRSILPSTPFHSTRVPYATPLRTCMTTPAFDVVLVGLRSLLRIPSQAAGMQQNGVGMLQTNRIRINVAFLFCVDPRLFTGNYAFGSSP